jgi:hypothetical protein
VKKWLERSVGAWADLPLLFPTLGSVRLVAKLEEEGCCAPPSQFFPLQHIFSAFSAKNNLQGPSSQRDQGDLGSAVWVAQRRDNYFHNARKNSFLLTNFLHSQLCDARLFCVRSFFGIIFGRKAQF